jgi:photosystem II stability/assembly factor-like uncharacterized protein
VYFADEQHGWVSGRLGNSGIILATEDGGETWDRQFEYTREVDELEFVSRTAGWALVHSTTGRDIDPDVLLHTTDGRHWTLLYKFVGHLQVDFVSPEIGWALTGDGKLLKTYDGGKTWSDSGLADVRSVCFGDELHGWIWTINSTSSETIHKMLRTSDGGVTWNQTDVMVGEVQCSGSQEAWVRSPGPFVGGTIIDYVLWHTGDGGIHWNPVLGHQSTGPLLNSIPTDPGPQPGPWTIGNNGSAYFVGFCAPCNEVGTSTILGTQDGGATWSAPVVLTELPRAHALSFPGDMHGWAVGGSTGHLLSEPVILATSDGGKTWVQQYP